MHGVVHHLQMPIEGSYYPPGGRAYYFTESGQQLGKLPKYDCDSGFNKCTNYYEANIVDRQCNKDFPSVSMGGYGYMFLWLCGQHRHCYGFHLISEGEGRKDPFCSLYKYMKDMPKDVFYDFACNLSEYALNREPDLFFSTHFWHDLFHSITHLCGPNFKSGRVLRLDGINTEISEQVNGYL